VDAVKRNKLGANQARNINGPSIPKEQACIPLSENRMPAFRDGVSATRYLLLEKPDLSKLGRKSC
jgi:hypothetical protein